MRFVINTPSGNIGKVVVDRLLQQNEEVILISRNPSKVEDFIKRGAQLVEGSIEDPQVIDRALKGAQGLFWLTPFVARSDYMEWAPHIAQIAANAVKKNGVERVVIISSAGAQHESGVGPIGVLPAIEESFKESAPNVTSLRAGSFMENFLNNVNMIVKTGTIFGPHPANKKIPMVATHDIGEKAAECLKNTHVGGFRVIGVHGPEDLDHMSAVKIIGEGIGRPVQYVEVSVEQAKQGMLQAGMPEVMVNLLGEMYTGFREGRMDRAEPRTVETTTRTSLLEFSRQVLKPVVDSAVTTLADTSY
jgi:uncharacterized protein YbjT (DUF2867 family)